MSKELVDGMPVSVLVKDQKKKYSATVAKLCGANGPFRVTATVRYDDQCGNGHNSFAITADIHRKYGNIWREDTGGCCHKEIIDAIPALAPFVRWHLTDAQQPLHYVANTAYHASNRDCWGLLKGELSTSERQMNDYICFGDCPIEFGVDKKLKAFIQKTLEEGGKFTMEAIAHKDTTYKYGANYQFVGMGGDWAHCKFSTAAICLQWIDALTNCKIQWKRHTTVIGDGKERDFEAARRCAIWPEATEAQLSLPRAELEELLMARLPKLIQDFKADIESLGFVY